MALRREDLSYPREAEHGEVVAFPLHVVRARARRRARLAMMRRRIVSVSIALLIGAGVLAGGGVGRSAQSTPQGPRAVTLKAGQTLWDVAERHAAPGSDPRPYVEALLRINGLEEPPPAGTRLRLPR